MSNQAVDPNMKFTGGLEIQFQNPSGWSYGKPSHQAMENQPLSAYVEAVLTAKGMEGRSFKILSFDPQTGQMVVEANLNKIP